MTDEEMYWKERGFLPELIDQLPAAIFWKNSDSVFLGCNKSFADFAHLENTDDIVGKTDYDLPWEKHQSDAYREDDRQVIQNKVPKLNIEEKQTLPDGREIILLTSKTPLFKNGKIIGILGVYQDITERNQKEEELRQSKERLEIANMLRTEFIRNMQHDIRTPIGGVRSMLSDMAENAKEEDLRKRLIMMRDSIEQLEVICNEVIDFDKIEHGDSPLIAKKFNLHDLVRRVISLNKSAAFVKNIQLDLQIDKDVPRVVKGDDHRTIRILMNLIGNAIKFTKEGNVSLVVKLGGKKEKQLILEFIIQDTGIGIPHEKRQFIYEKFARLNPSNQGMYKGSGLGLRIVKQFIEELEGEIDVQSEIGKGTTFYIALPFDECLIQEAHDDLAEIATFLGEKASSAHVFSGVKSSILHKTSNSDSKRMRMLVIEDDQLASMMEQRFLTQHGFEVQVVSNVKDAIAILDTTTFDAVLSDIGLPDGSGIDIINHVKRDKKSLNGAIPFYACTAHNDVEMLDRIKDAGFDITLRKPFLLGQAEALANYVRKKLDPNVAILEPAFKHKLPQHDIDVFNFERTYVLTSDEEIARQTLDKLMELLPLEIKEIKHYREKKDVENLRKIMHKIKGSLSYCCVPRLQESAEKLHAGIKAKNKSLSDINELFDAFYYEADIFIEEYQRFKEHTV